jgi:glutamate-1-semialdehyde 2,1-aminomutase
MTHARVDRPNRSETESVLLEHAGRCLAGGLVGNLRLANQLAFVVHHGKGARLYDMSGREYIDYLLGSGPLILGHAHPAVMQAVTEQLARGSTYCLTSEPSIRLAEELCRAIPCCEQVRFTASGSEATFLALRLARAFRRRDKVLKFEGAYHGSHDYALMSTSPDVAKPFPVAIPDSAGIVPRLESEVLVAPYNDLATTERIVATHADELAAIIVEPLQRIIPPVAEFLKSLRRLANRYEIPLIFDEVVTGFRLAYGGAQEYYGVIPDLAAYGKILGGGFSLGAVCGRENIMRQLDPRETRPGGLVVHGSTLDGNPIAAAAGLATLMELKRPGTYESLRLTGTTLQRGLARAIGKYGLTAQVVGEPVVFDVIFTEGDVLDYRSAHSGNRERLRRFNEECLKRGVLKGEHKIYMSLVHTNEDIDRTLAVFETALAELSTDNTAAQPDGL